jgi:hypothetical protein
MTEHSVPVGAEFQMGLEIIEEMIGHCEGPLPRIGLVQDTSEAVVSVFGIISARKFWHHYDEPSRLR